MDSTTILSEMANLQTLQPPTKATKNPITEHIDVKEIGESVKYSQNQKIETEEVDDGVNSTNSQVSFTNF